MSRNMYFAMVSKGDGVKSVFKAVGIGVIAVYGAKKLLGDDVVNGIAGQLKDKILTGTAKSETVKSAGSTGGDSAINKIQKTVDLTKGVTKLLFVASEKLSGFLGDDEDTDDASE